MGLNVATLTAVIDAETGQFDSAMSKASGTVEPMAPAVTEAEREKVLSGGANACEIEGACSNGTSPDEFCFHDQFRDGNRIGEDC